MPEDTKNTDSQSQADSTATNDNLPSSEEFAKLQADNVKSHEALSKVQGAYQEVNQKLEAFGDITPERVKELLRLEQDTQATQAGIDPVEFNTKLEEKVAAVHADLGSKLEAVQAQLETEKAKNHRYEVVNTVMNEHAGRVNEDIRSDVADAVAKYVRRDETGELFVVDDAGNTRYSPTRASQKMNPAELFAEFESVKPSWFKAQGINKGSRQPGGQQVQGSADTGFNYERAIADKEYRESLPFEQRKQVYQRWEEEKRG